jgi:hypothetical protein
MDSKEAIEIIKVLQDFYSDNRFADIPLDEKENQALDIAIAYIKIWDKFYKDIEQLRDEQTENLKGFNGTYRDGYRDALDVILLSMETRKEGIEK